VVVIVIGEEDTEPALLVAVTIVIYCVDAERPVKFAVFVPSVLGITGEPLSENVKLVAPVPPVQEIVNAFGATDC